MRPIPVLAVLALSACGLDRTIEMPRTAPTGEFPPVETLYSATPDGVSCISTVERLDETDRIMCAWERVTYDGRRACYLAITFRPGTPKWVKDSTVEIACN